LAASGAWTCATGGEATALALSAAVPEQTKHILSPDF